MDSRRPARPALIAALKEGHGPSIAMHLGRLGLTATEYAAGKVLVSDGSGGWVLLWQCGDHWRVNGRRVRSFTGIRREVSKPGAAAVSSKALRCPTRTFECYSDTYAEMMGLPRCA